MPRIWLNLLAQTTLLHTLEVYGQVLTWVLNLKRCTNCKRENHPRDNPRLHEYWLRTLTDANGYLLSCAFNSKMRSQSF